jgi:hypothetical protein
MILLEVKPTVGFKPTTLFLCDGEMIEPSVSLPSVTVANPIAAATPDPEELPEGSCLGMYAPKTCPPLELHPFELLPLR